MNSGEFDDDGESDERRDSLALALAASDQLEDAHAELDLESDVHALSDGEPRADGDRDAVCDAAAEVETASVTDCSGLSVLSLVVERLGLELRENCALALGRALADVHALPEDEKLAKVETLLEPDCVGDLEPEAHDEELVLADDEGGSDPLNVALLSADSEGCSEVLGERDDV